MERLTWMLTRMLRGAARLLPPGRAVQAEAELVPAGWPRVGWLAGGLRLARRRPRSCVSRVLARSWCRGSRRAWAVWLSWHTSPAADALTVTDRVRVLVGVGALALLPWVGRRRGWFGPVGGSITARLVRVRDAPGCAAWARPSCGWTATSTRPPWPGPVQPAP